MPDAEAVVPIVNKLREKHFDMVFLCTTQHPLSHCSFASNNPVSDCCILRSCARAAVRNVVFLPNYRAIDHVCVAAWLLPFGRAWSS